MTTTVAPRSTSPVSAPPPARVESRWTTPRLIQALIVAIVVGALIFYLALLAGVTDVRGTIKTVGPDSAPSILATLELRAQLANYDANVANLLLLSDEHSINVADVGLRDSRQIISNRLIDAAQNITYGDRERAPLLVIMDRFIVYQTLTEQARALKDKDPDQSRERYRWATDMMHLTILPAADELEKIHSDELNRIYNARQGNLTGAVLIFGTGGLLLLLLVGAQVFLLRRTRRVVNPPLAAATLLTLVFLAVLGSALTSEAQALKSAKQDAFDSLNAMWSALSVAYDANGDESLYLFFKDRREQYTNSFNTKVSRLIDPKDQLVAAWNNAPWFQQLLNDTQVKQGNRYKVDGYLAAEWRNVAAKGQNAAFQGEAARAQDALKNYGEYLAIDGQVRQLVAGGDQAGAIARSLSNGPNNPDGAFQKFARALRGTGGMPGAIDINQNAFNQAIDRSFGAVANYEWFGLVAVLLIVGLAFLGLRPRLREYAL